MIIEMNDPSTTSKSEDEILSPLSGLSSTNACTYLLLIKSLNPMAKKMWRMSSPLNLTKTSYFILRSVFWHWLCYYTLLFWNKQEKNKYNHIMFHRIELSVCWIFLCLYNQQPWISKYDSNKLTVKKMIETREMKRSKKLKS